jgi:cytochrome P450
MAVDFDLCVDRIAGGETVATFLAAVTYFLLKDPELKSYNRLCKEIRAAFKTYLDINATTAQQLPFLQAVINEGLRIYPPGSQGFPRISPGQEIDGYWIPKGVCLQLYQFVLDLHNNISTDRSVHQCLDYYS